MTDPVDPPVEPDPPVEVEPEPDGQTIPEGVAWSAATPHVLAIMHATADRIATLTAQVESLTDRLDDLDPPQEAP